MKKFLIFSLIAILLTGAIVFAQTTDPEEGGSEPPAPIEDANKNYDPTAYLVIFKKDKLDISTEKGRAKAKELIEQLKQEFRITRFIENLNLAVVWTGGNELKVKDFLKDSDYISSINHNYYYSLHTKASDPLYEYQTAYFQTQELLNRQYGQRIEEAWDYTEYNQKAKPNNNIIVAIIDSGIDYNHRDLVGLFWDGSKGCKTYNNKDYQDDDGGKLPCKYFGWNFINDPDYNLGDFDADTLDDYGHGTAMAGIIAANANNGRCVAGINRKIKLMSLKVFGYNGDARGIVGTTEALVSAFEFARYNGASIINASWGGNTYDPVLYSAIDGFVKSGGIVVTSAGNSSESLNSAPVYPCSFKNDQIIGGAIYDPIICVGATSYDSLEKTASTNYSNKDVDFFAKETPGALLGGNTYYNGDSCSENPMGGSSFATAQVTGSYALLMRYYFGNRDKRPMLDCAMKAGADNLITLMPYVKDGRQLNLLGAIKAAKVDLPQCQAMINKKTTGAATVKINSVEIIPNKKDENGFHCIKMKAAILGETGNSQKIKYEYFAYASQIDLDSKTRDGIPSIWEVKDKKLGEKDVDSKSDSNIEVALCGLDFDNAATKYCFDFVARPKDKITASFAPSKCYDRKDLVNVGKELYLELYKPDPQKVSDQNFFLNGKISLIDSNKNKSFNDINVWFVKKVDRSNNDFGEPKTKNSPPYGWEKTTVPANTVLKLSSQIKTATIGPSKVSLNVMDYDYFFQMFAQPKGSNKIFESNILTYKPIHFVWATEDLKYRSGNNIMKYYMSVGYEIKGDENEKKNDNALVLKITFNQGIHYVSSVMKCRYLPDSVKVVLKESHYGDTQQYSSIVYQVEPLSDLRTPFDTSCYLEVDLKFDDPAKKYDYYILPYPLSYIAVTHKDKNNLFWHLFYYPGESLNELEEYDDQNNSGNYLKEELAQAKAVSQQRIQALKILAENNGVPSITVPGAIVNWQGTKARSVIAMAGKPSNQWFEIYTLTSSAMPKKVNAKLSGVSMNADLPNEYLNRKGICIRAVVQTIDGEIIKSKQACY